MVSTRSGNEPLTTTSLAPSDSELFRGGYHDLGLEFRAPRGHDPAIVGEEVQAIIMDALRDAGREDIAEMLR